MAIQQLHKQIWINPDHITHVVLWNDQQDDNREKAKVYFSGRAEPLELSAQDTLRLFGLFDPPSFRG